MSNAINTIKIGRTTYTITQGGASSTDYITAQVYVEGPRGGIKNIIAFTDGGVRVVSYSRGCCPRESHDIWGKEADAIREAVIAFAASTTTGVAQ